MAFRDAHRHKIQENSYIPWATVLHWNDIPSARRVLSEAGTKGYNLKKVMHNNRLYFNALDIPKATSDLASMTGYK